MKNPEIAVDLRRCPFCGGSPRVFWNGGMVIRCINVDCLQPRTEWWSAVDKCVAQWNMRYSADAATQRLSDELCGGG